MPRGKECRPTHWPDRQITHTHSLTHTGKTSANGGRSHSYGSQRNMPCPRKEHCSIQRATGRQLCRPFWSTATIFSSSSIQFSLGILGEADGAQNRSEMARNGFHPTPNWGSFSKRRKTVSVTIAISFELKTVVRPIKYRNLSLLVITTRWNSRDYLRATANIEVLQFCPFPESNEKQDTVTAWSVKSSIPRSLPHSLHLSLP